MCTHTHTHVEHAVMAFASRCLPMAYQMRFTCPLGKAWEQHVNDASQPNYLRFRRETGGQISDGMDVNFQHESIKCCPQLNKTHKRKNKKRDLASAQEGLCAPFLPRSLLYLSSCSLHSPGGLWWKKCQMITLLWAPSGSLCTYSTHHISHFPASLLRYSSTLNPLFCRGEVNKSHSQQFLFLFDYENTATFDRNQS